MEMRSQNNNNKKMNMLIRVRDVCCVLCAVLCVMFDVSESQIVVTMCLFRVWCVM